MLGLHLISEFLNSLGMNHARDVINGFIIESVQKTFARDHFELVWKIFISIIFLGSQGLNTDVFCIGLQKILSEGQEIDIRSNFFRKGPFWDFWLNLFFLLLLSLNVKVLRRLLPFWCLSVDESRDTTKNIFSISYCHHTK